MTDTPDTTPTPTAGNLPAKRPPGRPRLPRHQLDNTAHAQLVNALLSADLDAIPPEARAASPRVRVALLLHAGGWPVRTIAEAINAKSHDTIHRMLRRYDPQGVFKTNPAARKALAAARWYGAESKALARVESADLSETSPAQALTMAAIARDKLNKLEESTAERRAEPSLLRLRLEAVLDPPSSGTLESRLIDGDRATTEQQED